MHNNQDDPTAEPAVRSTIRLLIPLDRQSEALDLLASVKAEIQYQPSCVGSRLYREVDDVRAIMVEELWENEQEIKRHLKSDVYRRVLLAIEMAEEPPEVRFDTIASTGGVETIEQARRQS